MKKTIILIITLLILASGGVFAQNAQELRLDSIVSGNLRVGQEIWYSVYAASEGLLIVETMGTTDTYLEAYRVIRGSERELIAEDDDSGESANARIKIVVKPNTTYLFKLKGYGSTATGPYRIFASMDPLPQSTALRIGTLYSGSIVSGDEYWFSVIPAQNGILSMETISSIDTYLEAYDENYNLLGEDDDGGDGLNARLEINARAGNTYYFKVRGINSVEHGPYRLSSGIRNYPTPVQLRFDTLISGNIKAGEEYWYSIRTTQRGTLVVGTMGNTDTFMDVYDESYLLLSSDDDSGEGTNAKVSIETDANKTYIIKVKGISSQETGAFRIYARME